MDDQSGTMYIHGYPIAPCVIADAKGNCSVIMVSHHFAQSDPTF